MQTLDNSDLSPAQQFALGNHQRPDERLQKLKARHTRIPHVPCQSCCCEITARWAVARSHDCVLHVSAGQDQEPVGPLDSEQASG